MAQAGQTMIGGVLTWTGGPYSGMPVASTPSDAGNLAPYATGGGTDPTGRVRPSPAASRGLALGITAGEYDDYMAQSKLVLSRAGIVEREPSDAEIVQFAQSKLKFDQIDNFYRNLPEFVANQPGLPYGLSKEDYQQQRSEMEQTAAGKFDTTTTTGAEPDYVKEAFKEKMSPGEVGAGLADQFKRLGAKAPTAKDVAAIRTRPKITTQDDRAGPRTTPTEIGPTSTVQPSAPASPFARRR